jgi:hypothetical protein
MAGGLGPELTAAQDDKTLTITTNNPQLGEVKTVYNLDGSESKNPINFGGQTVDRISKVKWDGAKLVITTTINVNGNPRRVDSDLDARRIRQSRHRVVVELHPARRRPRSSLTRRIESQKLLTRGQPLSNVGGRRKAAFDLLGKQHCPVQADVEHTAVALDQFNRQVGFLLQRSFQPGSLGQVVSTDAVFDRQAHGVILRPPAHFRANVSTNLSSKSLASAT